MLVLAIPVLINFLFLQISNREGNLSLEKHSKITYPNGEIVEDPIKDERYLCTYPNGDTLECDRFSMPGRCGVYPVPTGDGIYKFTDGSVLCGYWNTGGRKDGTFYYTAPDDTKTIRIYERDELLSETLSEE